MASPSDGDPHLTGGSFVVPRQFFGGGRLVLLLRAGQVVHLPRGLEQPGSCHTHFIPVTCRPAHTTSNGQARAKRSCKTSSKCICQMRSRIPAVWGRILGHASNTRFVGKRIDEHVWTKPPTIHYAIVRNGQGADVRGMCVVVGIDLNTIITVCTST